MTIKMLPLALVFLFAQSAFALPSVGVNFVNYGEVPTSSVTDRFRELIDGGDTNLYSFILFPTIDELASIGSASSRATALTQLIATVAESAYGIPGDSCQPANLINAYVNSGGKTTANLCGALRNYVNRLNGYIDSIVSLVLSPNSLRFASGPRGNCIGGGRTYQFDQAWNLIIEYASPAVSGLLNEEFCGSKRLYRATSIRSNNVAAAATASAVTQVGQVAKSALGPLSNFVIAVANGANPTLAAAIAKTALLSGLAVVKC